MKAQALEAFLARLYTDARALERFLAAPRIEAERAGLDPDTCAALVEVDRTGLELAVASFGRKRASQRCRSRRGPA